MDILHSTTKLVKHVFFWAPSLSQIFVNDREKRVKTHPEFVNVKESKEENIASIFSV
jgi:hypothetical protein